MNFLPDIFKKDPDKSFILNYAPIFAGLNIFEKNLIAQKSKVVEYKKGDIIYKQSSAQDCFYCVITGRVRIFTHSKKPQIKAAYEAKEDGEGEDVLE